MAEQPTYEYEQAVNGIAAGVDEVGRGPLAGPVVAAAVILDPASMPSGLADSKTLTEKRREALAPLIREACQFGVGVCTVAEIDEHNILQASLLAMARAINALPTRPNCCLIDGNKPPKIDITTQCIVKGDAKSLSIAAASIIAKTIRDQIMRDLAVEFPQYGWEKNKGYGSRVHIEALHKFGPTPHHRRSFEPVKSMAA